MKPASRRIDAITFDVGGTLIRPWPSVGHGYAEMAARNGFSGFSCEELNRAFKRAWSEAEAFDYTRSGWERLVNQTFARSLPGGVPFFNELYERFAEPDAWHVFDDALETLDTLASAGVRLAVISNWDDRLRPLLQRLRLEDYFETISVSCEVGFAKPSPVIFQHTAAKLGVAPELILHVGDSAELDAVAAKAAGFEAVHLRREMSRLSGGEIGVLTELIDLVGADKCG